MAQNNKFTPHRTKKIETQILTTWGMSSAVFDPDPANPKKYKHIGHIFAGDYDGEDFLYVHDEAMKNMYCDDEWVQHFPELYPKIGWYEMFPGISAIFKSSKTGYHLWNLTIRGRLENALISLQAHTDQAHNAASFRRHCWILRVTPKVEGSGEDKVYKPAPVLKRIIYSPTDRPQSMPHYRLLQALAQNTNVPIKFPSTKDINFNGVTFDIEFYKTMTDEMKKKWTRLKGDD